MSIGVTVGNQVVRKSDLQTDMPSQYPFLVGMIEEALKTVEKRLLGPEPSLEGTVTLRLAKLPARKASTRLPSPKGSQTLDGKKRLTIPTRKRNGQG